MNGSYEPENPKDVQCKHCGRYFRNDGIAGHEPNCPLREEDVVIVPLVGANEGADPLREGPPTPADPDAVEGAGGLTPGGATPDPDAPDVDDDPGRAVTDGGQRRAPPSFDVDRDPVDDQDDVKDAPDHFVDVDVWIRRVEDRNPNLAETDDWARICANAENFDHVDVRKTDLEAGRVVME